MIIVTTIFLTCFCNTETQVCIKAGLSRSITKMSAIEGSKISFHVLVPPIESIFFRRTYEGKGYIDNGKSEGYSTND